MDILGEGNCDLLNFDQEDDNLLGISPTELCLGVSPSSPSMLPCIMTLGSMEDLENHFGEEKNMRASDSSATLASLPSRSHVIPSSVLSVLNFNEMNQRRIEELWSKKGIGIKGAL